MKTIGFLIAIFVLLAVLGSYFMNSDIGLLGDAYTLDIASRKILGNRFYGVSCPRDDYADEVETVHGPESGSSTLFKFAPRPGKERVCPPVSVEVDSHTGRAWLVTN